MRINSLSSSYNYPVYQQSFRGQIGQVKDIAHKVQCFGNTQFFRGDLVWDKLAKFLDKHFANAEKVTFINHVCSSGEEPYSVVMKLISDLGDRAKKFFPIIARDLSPNNIRNAQEGRIVAEDYEKRMIEAMTNNQSEKFVDIIQLGNNNLGNLNGINAVKTTMSKRYLIIPNNKIKDKIDFSVGNVLEDVKNLPEKNTVLFCRNVWQYLKRDEREYLISEISKKFKDDSSILFIGQADIDNSNLLFLLEKYNFKETEFPFAYVKSSEPNPISKYLNLQNAVYLK